MRLWQIECFLAVNDAQSFTRAAEQLYVAQPSVSQQVKSLESELKFTLFDRTPHGIRLTAAGRAFLPTARAVKASLTEAESVADEIRLGRRGHLEVLTLRSLATGVFPTVVSDWHVHHPNTIVEVKDFFHSDELESAFVDDTADVAVGPRPTQGMWEVEVLGYEELVLACPPDSPLAPPATLSVRDLADSEWILFDKHRGLTKVVRTLCHAHGFEPKVISWTGHVEAALQLAAKGIGISLIPDNAVHPNVSGAAVNRLSPPVFREICAYVRSDTDGLTRQFVRSMKTSECGLVQDHALPDGAITV